MRAWKRSIITAAIVLILLQAPSSFGKCLTAKNAGSLNWKNCGAPDDTFEVTLSPWPPKPYDVLNTSIQFTPEVDVLYATDVWDLWYQGYHIAHGMKANICTDLPSGCKLHAHEMYRMQYFFQYRIEIAPKISANSAFTRDITKPGCSCTTKPGPGSSALKWRPTCRVVQKWTATLQTSLTSNAMSCNHLFSYFVMDCFINKVICIAL